MSAAVLLIAASCGGNAASQVATTSGAIDDGQALYETSCAQCHGIDLRVSDNGPSFLSAVYRPDHHADAAFLLAVARGVSPHHWSFGPMPPIDGLSQRDVVAITAYVRSVQAQEGFED